MILPTLVGPSYRSMSRTADPSECVNWYVERVEDANAKAPAVCYPTPGFTAHLDLTPGPIRAEHQAYDGRVFVVSGFNLYEVLSTGTSSLRGTVSVDTNPATISSNGAAGGQLFITSGDVGYNYDLATNVLSVVLASGAAMGAYLNNVFISLDTTLSTIRLSDLDDGTTWDPTQFAQRSLAADPWVSMTIVNSEIWLLGEVTSEVWANQGLFPFPFAPIPGAFFNTGCAAPYSAAVVNSTLIWVAKNDQGDGMICRGNGYAAERLSTHPVEFAIQGYANVSDAVTFTYQEMGHAFWVCSFVDGKRSWCYDVVSGLWHERGFWNVTTSSYEASRVMYHCQSFSGTHLVGSRLDGQTYLLSNSVATDVDGTGIRRLRVFRGLDAEQDQVAYPWLQIEMQSGVGIATGQGSDPQAMLQMSKDGGYSWGAERWEPMGKIGEYLVRTVWRRLGQARNAVFRLVVSDPVYPVALIQAIVKPIRGAS
ncbi:MAG: hypothetical protein HQ485_13895 [Acidobacteria bacterium]|nr:hypothetical protein [Acidobacteriota bacterium]